MFAISNQSDYGLIVLSYLSKKKKQVPLSELITETKLPKRFVARIAAALAKNKLLLSREGRVGGYQITDKINTINFYDYLKIFENDVDLSKCDIENKRCRFKKICEHRNFLHLRLQRLFIEELKKIKLKTVFN
jgi:Rrf2 family protein